MIWLATASLLTLAILLISVLIRYRSFVLTLLLTPLLVFGLGFSWQAYDEIRGRPVASMPQEGSRLVHGINAKPWIYIWVVDQEGHRLHQIPWTEKNQEKVNQAVKEAKKGRIMQLKGNKDEPESPFEFYQWDHTAAMPKNHGK